MINPALKMELTEYLGKHTLVEEFPNIFLFLEKTLATMEQAELLGL